MTADDLWGTVFQASQKLGTSVRRPNRFFRQVLGMTRSTLRYEVRAKGEDDLRLALIRLAKQYGWYSYRKVGQLLRIGGWCAIYKKVERIWREEGLQLPKRHKRCKRLYHHDASVIRLRPHSPNHIQSINFVHEKFSNHRPYKMLTVVNEYTREALSVTVANTVVLSEVFEALYLLLLKRGKPQHLGSDNGPEFSSYPFKDELTKVGINPIRIYPESLSG